MAAGASNTDVGAGKGKGRVVMVKRPLAPGDSVVTDLASRRKAKLNVIDGRQSIVVIGLVTTHTGRVRQTVVVVDVARSAGHAYVRAGQSPAGRGMVEGRSRPRGS